MVTLPPLTATTQTRPDHGVTRDDASARPVLAGLPGGDSIVRGGGTRAQLATDTTRPAPDAPKPAGVGTRIAAGIGAYSVGTIIGAGVAVALGAGLGPILLLGVVAGVAAAKGTDNWLTMGRIFP